MNSYQLISKLRKVRDDTYLTAIDQQPRRQKRDDPV